MACLATMLAIPAFVSATAPYTEAKFQNALAASKYQNPDSTTAATSTALIAGFEQNNSDGVFEIQDTDKMAFGISSYSSGSVERAELRNLNNWNVNTTVQTAHANVTVTAQANDKVTILQIHDDANSGVGTGPNKPLLRIYRDASDGKMWATIKDTAAGDTNLPIIDLGTMNLGTYYDVDITVDNGALTIAVDSVVSSVNAMDVSFWNWPSYWKAGAYLQDGPSATVRFNELTWPGAKTLVDDDFADGDPANTGSLQAAWYSSSSSGGNSVEAATNELGLVSGTSGRGLHGIFEPETLEVGESLVATLTFTTPATVGVDKTGGLKVALMDYNDAGLGADLTSSSGSVNPLYTDLPGYYVDFDVNTTLGTDDIGIYEHDSNATGRFLGTSGEWTSLGNGANDGFDFLASTEYVVVVSVTRTGADTMDVTGSLASSDGTVLSNYAVEDATGIANHFGMLGIWANASAFGSATTAIPDNGLTFSNIKVELVNENVNQAPAFTFNPTNKADATQDVAYVGTLAGDATDLEGDTITFSSADNPSWLTVGTDGSLSGTPLVGDLGLNTFTVSVLDASGSNTSTTATVNITVDAPASGGTTIVDDNFTDEDRTDTSTEPLEANWWSSSSTSGTGAEIDANGLGLVTGTSGRGIHGTFTPQNIDVGGKLTATLTFTTPATVTGVAKSDSFKIALMDFNNPGLAADLSSSSSSSNPLYVGQPGYLMQFDVNSGAGANINYRKHDTASALGRFLGTSSEWTNSNSSSAAGYTFAASTEYVVVMELSRTAVDSMDITATLSQGGSPLDTHTVTDASAIANNIGMLGIWVNSNVFGSSNSSGLGVDNGLTFSNVTVEVEGASEANLAPVFTSNPINEASAIYDTAYSSTLADNASDAEGDTLTFTKTAGPSWLSVAANGDLTGTPLIGDLGANAFTVEVVDAAGSNTTVSATLNITVEAPFGGGLLVDDNFTDINRAATGSPDALDANWWSSSSSSGSAIEIDVNGLGIRSGTSGRGIHGTFSPQTLAIAETMTATLTFTTPVTVGTDRDGALKFALMDLNNGGLAADLNSSSSTPNPLYVGQPGYMVDFDVNNVGNTATKGDDNAVIRKHDVAASGGRFLGTTGEWDQLSASADDAGGFTILANTEYVVVLSVTRTNTDSMDITATLSQGGSPLVTHTASDISGIANNFGMLGAWVNSNTFGSTNSAGAGVDNGITFTNIQVETTTSANTPPVTADNSATIAEDAAISSAVVTVAGSDAETGVTYEITGGNTGDAFAIDGSGNITVAAALDFATNPSYSLTVTVSDTGTPVLKDTATVTITVTEVVASGYTAWSSGFSLVDATETGDDDLDNIENVLEYILGGDPTVADLSILPTDAINGANYELTFTRSDDSEADTTLTVQFGSDLTAFPATTTTVPAASGTVGSITFTITENGVGDDDVTASIPHADATEFFGRISGTLNP